MKAVTLIYVVCFTVMMGMTIGPVPLNAAPPPAEKYFDAPVMPGGAVVNEEGVRVELTYDLPYETVLAWYQAAFKDYKDEKYRDWKEQMYIEDQGGAKWHSIGISKGGGNRTSVTIVKDNWTWIFSTLLIRFLGVFIVLLSLMVLLMISSVIMRKFIDKGKGKASAAD